MSLTALFFALAAAGAAAPASESTGRGAKVASAKVTVEILRPVIVRQASGIQERRDAPKPQVTRRARTVLYEFE